MKTKKKPCYFDPYIYQKVLEDAWLPSIAEEILMPWRVRYKHKFLFAGFKERAKEFLEKEEKFISDVVDEETFYNWKELIEYIGFSEEEQQQWFEKLREDFNLPPDYEFK